MVFICLKNHLNPYRFPDSAAFPRERRRGHTRGKPIRHPNKTERKENKA